MILQDSVTKTPKTADDRVNIVNHLWKNKVQISLAKLDWRAFFVYYTDECNSALFYDGNATIETHQDLVDIAQKLQDGCKQDEITRDIVELYKKTTRKARTEDQMKNMAEGSLKLAVRLVAMVDIGSISPNYIQGYTCLGWSDPHQNLQTFLRDRFKENASVLGFSKFGRLFNARNLQRYAGLKIRWTDNLNNHLRLVDEDTTLCVFHHVTFLKGQDSAIFPEGFLKETLNTLELLFPPYDKPTSQWLERELKTTKATLKFDLGLLGLDRLMPQDCRIEKFRFWHDELVELKERFDKPGLTSISQLWYDRRNRGQWITFWIGSVILIATLLALILGVLQTALSAVQVYKAYHPTLD